MNGYIALISVLIISATVLVLAASAGLLGIGESNMGLETMLLAESHHLATSCAEEALNKLKLNLNYFGNENITVGSSTCSVEPVEGTGNQDRIVKVSASVGDQTAKIKVEISRVNPFIKISSWERVADF